MCLASSCLNGNELDPRDFRPNSNNSLPSHYQQMRHSTRCNKKQTVILPKTTNSLSRRLHPIHANNLEMRYVFLNSGFMLEGDI